MKAVNLIPTEQRASARPVAGKTQAASPGSSPVGAYAILGFLALAIVAAALYVMAGNKITENKAELAQVEQEASAVEARASSLQSFADFQQLADSRQQTVTALAGARFGWSQTLSDLSRALPSDVFISSLDGSTASSSTGSGLRGAISAPSIELAGCTKDQGSVARLMSSLREVRGVTRVSLAKSEKNEFAETAVAPAPATPVGEDAPAVTTEPCPPGAPPTFDVIVFFERAAISANAAPNAGAPVSAIAPTGPTGPVASTTTTTSTTP